MSPSSLPIGYSRQTERVWPKSREAMTLIEVILVGSIMVMSIGFMTEWTIRMVRLNKRVEQSVYDRQSLDRLGAILISDSRDALEWIQGEKAFAMDEERRVVYSEQDDSLIRIETLGQKVLQREFYRLPKSYRLVWPESAHVHQRIVWELRFNDQALPTSQSHAADSWRVEIAIGRRGGLHVVEPPQKPESESKNQMQVDRLEIKQ